MSNKAPGLDAAYVDRKRQQLLKLRAALQKTSDAAETEEGNLNKETNLQAREYEDDAQRLDMLEKEGNLIGRDVERLARVQRALEKIAEGTYGFSDVSGTRIAQDRLDAMPEAINTAAEQKSTERGG
jgi:DnaK suppressor protein